MKKPSDKKQPKANPNLPQPPRHLRADGKELWFKVLSEYDLPPEALLVLTMAAESFDRMHSARRLIERKGQTYSDRFGQPKMRPEVLVERDSRTSVARLLKQLGLDLEPLHDRPGRPGGR